MVRLLYSLVHCLGEEKQNILVGHLLGKCTKNIKSKNPLETSQVLTVSAKLVFKTLHLDLPHVMSNDLSSAV